MTTGITNTSQQSIADTTTQSAKSNDVNKDQFLKLLTYQLRSQNPLQPYDNQEFATQLAQFSQLEQLTGIRSLLQEQVASNQALSRTITNSALPGMLGKSAKAFADSVFFDGNSNSDLGYNLKNDASTLEITIKNSSGAIVRNIKLDGIYLKAGDVSYSWNGKDNGGNTLPQGKYTFELKAADAKGVSVATETFVTGKIQAVKFKAEGTVLVINGMEIPLENILDVTT